MTQTYVCNDLSKVLDEEKKLQFKYFDSETAWEITQNVINLVKKRQLKSVGIRVEYEGQTLLHYLMNNKKDSNWLDRKVKTVIDSQHCSLYTFLSDEYESWNNDETYAVCGGGFPIIEHDEVKGVIAVSGLEHIEDHKIIIEVLTKYLEV